MSFGWGLGAKKTNHVSENFSFPSGEGRGERLEVEATASDQLFNVSCVYNEASIKPRRAGFGDLLDDRTHEIRESDTTREGMEAPCPFPVSHPV